MSSYTYAALFQDPVKKVEKKDIKVKPNKSYKKPAEKAVPMKKDWQYVNNFRGVRAPFFVY